MEVLFLVSVGTAILWLAFGNKKHWSGMWSDSKILAKSERPEVLMI